jgi:hypothetical protein
MTRKQVRKAIFKDMLRRGKAWPTTLTAYKIAWLMEETGVSQVRAKRRLKLTKVSAVNHTLNLYHLRRGLLIKENEIEKKRTNKSA